VTCSSFEDPLGGLVPHGPVHCPSGGNVGHGQGETELPEAVASLVADEIVLHKSRDGVIPLGPSPDRDLGLQRGAWRGMGPAPRKEFGPFAGEFAVDGRGAHAYQQVGLGVGDLKLLVPAQQRYQDRQHRGQQPAGRGPQHRPAPDQRVQQVRAVDRRPARPGFDDLQHQGLPQRGTRKVTVPTGQLDQLVQDPGLSCTIGVLVGEGFLLCHSLPLDHR